MNIKSINLLAIVTIPLSIYLGYTGRVDWLLLVLVWLMSMSIDLPLRRKVKFPYSGNI